MKLGLTDRFLEPKGVLELWIKDAEGNVRDYLREPNMVTAAGRALMAAAAGEFVNRIGCGTNGAAATPDNTELTDAFYKAFDEVTFPDARTVRFAFSLAAGEYNGHQVREFGLVQLAGDPAVAILFNRKAFADGWWKDEQVQLVGAWTVTF